MKATAAIIVVVVLVGLGIWLTGNKPTEVPEGNPSGLSGQGSVVFGITDAAADMKNISDIRMTVSKIDLHSTADSWVTVSSETETYDLLALNASGDVVLAGWTNVAAGTYDEARLAVDKVIVVMKDGSTKTAKLPSGELKFMQDVTIAANATSSVTLDFLGDKSLHLTGNGVYVFTPVVEAETRENAEVAVDGQDRLTINKGTVRGKSSFGMDLNGEVKKNFQVKADAKIEIDAKGEIKLPAGLLKIQTGAAGNATSSAKTGDVLNQIKGEGGLNVNVGGALGGSPRTVSFTVTGSNFKFDLTEIKVKQGDKVRVTFVNQSGTHDWKLDEFSAKTKILSSGQSETVEFVANKKGTFEYYCSIGEHRVMGMKGNLIVE